MNIENEIKVIKQMTTNTFINHEKINGYTE